MKKLFVKLLFRNFLKDKLLNTINLLGLSMGLVASLLIVLYADHELSYDGFHADPENTYRMEAITNGDLWFSNLGMEHGKELDGGVYPEVKEVVQVSSHLQTFLKRDRQEYPESRIYQTTVGSAFFDLFNFEVLLGNEDRFLKEPFSTVITASTAKRIFGEKSPLGEVIKKDSTSLQVVGVIADIPTNTHLNFNLIFANPAQNQDDHYHTQTYVQLAQESDPKGLEEKILAMKVAYNEFHELNEVRLMPLTDIHYHSEAVFGAGGKGDSLQLTVFMVIGALILLISMANYINLSLAIYASKGMEIGMRKVLGESRWQIVKAFFWEGSFMTLLSLPLVFIGVFALLPLFNDFMEVDLQNKLLSSIGYWAGLLGFLLLLGLITILYPATVLSKTKINELIKTKSALNHQAGVKLRNLLIFFQFILLFTLGISAWFMNRQIDYLDHKDMGFESEGVIKVSNAYEIGEINNYRMLKAELLNSPLIAGVSFGPMMGDGMNPLAYKPEGQEQIFENLLSYGVDIDYFDVMGMDITEGDFKSVLQSAEDGQIVSLVNESFVNRFGWQAEPIGKKLILRPGTENELNRQVSAVFRDFHFFSLKERVTPQIISLRPDPQFVNTNLLIKTATPDMQAAVDYVNDKWGQFVKGIPLNYSMIDDAVKRMYAKERKTGRVSLAFSILAVSLSLTGLIGFMIYMTGLKSKEIAVRKVLGASLLQIIGLLNRQLFLAILVSALIGSALSYWLVSSWLADYAYSIPLDPLTFVASAALVYTIVFLITGVQSLKSAQINPVMALKHE